MFTTFAALAVFACAGRVVPSVGGIVGPNSWSQVPGSTYSSVREDALLGATESGVDSGESSVMDFETPTSLPVDYTEIKSTNRTEASPKLYTSDEKSNQVSSQERASYPPSSRKTISLDNMPTVVPTNNGQAYSTQRAIITIRNDMEKDIPSLEPLREVTFSRAETVSPATDSRYSTFSGEFTEKTDSKAIALLKILRHLSNSSFDARPTDISNNIMRIPQRSTARPRSTSAPARNVVRYYHNGEVYWTRIVPHRRTTTAPRVTPVLQSSILLVAKKIPSCAPGQKLAGGRCRDVWS